ncbi:hypothetical protein FD723_12895 [Nostoc sp. C052]|nr:hypothetical protein FD723_12895 [Nostoc sp. C052]
MYKYSDSTTGYASILVGFWEKGERGKKKPLTFNLFPKPNVELKMQNLRSIGLRLHKSILFGYVFVMIHRIFAIYNFHQKILTELYWIANNEINPTVLLWGL